MRLGGTAMATALMAAWPGGGVLAAGVAVESVQAGFAAHEAGLRAGDVLTAWERAAAPPANPEPLEGTLGSPFDLAQVEREQAPRGAVTLRGERGGAPLAVRVPAGEWRIVARPAAPAEGDPVQAAWRAFAAAEAAVRERRWDAAGAAFEEAVRAAGASGDGVAVVVAQRARARFLHDRSQWEPAIAAYDAALAADRALAPEGLGVAWVHHQLARLWESRGDLAAAEEHNRRALELRERLAPGSADVAASLLNVGNVAKTRGDLATAEGFYRRSLALYEALSVTAGVGFGLNNLGIVAAQRGDLRTAEDYFRRGLVIEDRLRPGTVEQARALHNVGIVSRRRGDLAAAERHMTRALAIFEELGAEPDAANLMTSLGVVYKERDDLEGAEGYYRRALALYEKLAPGSADAAATHNNLANVRMWQGDVAGAEEHYRRAVELQEKLGPDNLAVAASVNGLAEAARQRGDLPLARTHAARSLAIVERLAPQGQNAEAALRVSGDIAMDAGDLAAAEGFYRRALKLRRQMGEGLEAEACHGLAVLHRRRKDLDQALGFHRCALDALDTRRRTVGGTDESRSAFGRRFAGYYRDAIEVLMELGRPAEAFHVLERHRARAFLSMLAERELVFARDVPEDLDRERRALNVEFERTLQRAAAAKPADLPKQREALADVRRRQGLVREKIRSASPRLAGLEYPEPLDLPSARAALDPGTVLLSYSLGPERGHLFAVGPGPEDFLAVPLAVRLDDLRGDAARFRELMSRPQVLQRAQLQALARRLGDTLLRPAAGAVGRAERLLVVPDGPLHLVPFAALADPTSPRGFRYLAESKPVHVAASATVFAELKRRGPARRTARLVAFGDADYSAAGRAAAPAGAMRVARERGLDLRPLPASRAEVLGLKALYPGSSRVFMGAEASEENAKAIGPEPSLVHFATHGLADERSPLESTLALTLPGPQAAGENGLLQAWEIFEQLRIDADLVTLSACGTARGKEMSGEGILGLTRAFQHAGARTVLASLWEVADASTADLMQRFYRHLSAGVPPAEALRRAQVALLRRPATSAPYYWAAFTLAGAAR
jgi:CHAT domain-containing protein/tetratricopeptide (TPR) repeat protein